MKRDARHQEGFVLAITLWILALLTLAASFFAVWAQDALDITRQSKDDAQGEIDALSTLNIALYLLSTQRITARGLPTPMSKTPSATSLPGRDPMLSLAGETYRGVGAAFFSIQDEGGLLKPTALARFPQFFTSLGVPAGAVPPLVNKLLDFIDNDNLTRINGAEAIEYGKAKLPPPPNRKLFTSWEPRAVMDWGQHKGLWKEHALPRLMTTVDKGGIMNFNTAPAGLLKIFAGLDDEAVKRIIARRQQVPFMNTGDVSNAMGKPMALFNLEMEVEIDPTTHYRITVWNKGGLRMREIHVNLTLADATAARPWLLDYSLIIPLTMEQKSANEQYPSPSIFTKALLPGP